MRKYFREVGVFGLFVLSEEVNKRMNSTKNARRSKSRSKSLNTKESISKKSKSLNTKKSISKKSKKSKSLANNYNNKLITYNKYAAAIQLLNGTIQFFFVKRQKNKKNDDDKPYITYLYMKRLKTGRNRKIIGKFKVGNLMVIFSLLTALSHISFITDRKSIYIDNYIKNQVNTQRWLEYSVTSSIMMFSFMGVSRIDSLVELIPLTFLVGITNIFGLLIEQSKELDMGNKRKLLYYSGVLTNGIPWMYVNYKNKDLFNLTKDEFTAILSKTNEGKILDEKEMEAYVTLFFDVIIPTVRRITYFMQGLYYLFGLNMNQKYIKPMKNKEKLSPVEFYELERNYIFLSMVAKSFLSWIIWSATLRPNRND